SAGHEEVLPDARAVGRRGDHPEPAVWPLPRRSLPPHPEEAVPQRNPRPRDEAFRPRNPALLIRGRPPSPLAFPASSRRPPHPVTHGYTWARRKLVFGAGGNSPPGVRVPDPRAASSGWTR